MATAAVPQETTAPAIEWQARHTSITRLTHWIRVVAMLCLIGSGLQIFNAYPRLHWGKAGSEHDPAWLAIDARGTPARGVLIIGTTEFTTTGFLGVSTHKGALEARAFPSAITIPAARDLASARRWHFFWAWVFVLNGLLYLGAGLATGSFQKKMFPTADQLKPSAVWAEVKDHARFHFPKGEGARHYNVIQKFTYLTVLWVLLPLIVLTGLTMSPGFTAAIPLDTLFGGRQTARSLHFITMNLLIAFIAVHVGLVLVAGFGNLMRSMITGKFAIRKGVH